MNNKIHCQFCRRWHEPNDSKGIKCDPKVLAAIDAVMKREDLPEPPRSYGQRLAEGFHLMSGPSGEL